MRWSAAGLLGMLIGVACCFADVAPDLMVGVWGDRGDAAAFVEGDDGWVGIDPGDAVATCRDSFFERILPAVPSNIIYIRIRSAGRYIVSEAVAPARSTTTRVVGALSEAHHGYRKDVSSTMEWRSRGHDAPRKETRVALGTVPVVKRYQITSTVQSAGTSSSDRQADILSDATVIGAGGRTGRATQEAVSEQSSVVSTQKSSGRDIHKDGRSTSATEHSSDRETLQSGFGVVPQLGQSESTERTESAGLRSLHGGEAEQEVLRTDQGVHDQRSLSEVTEEWRSLGLHTESFEGGRDSHSRRVVEHPFSLKISSDRYEVMPGEIITLTAVFTNEGKHSLIAPEIALALPRGLEILSIESRSTNSGEQSAAGLVDDNVAVWHLTEAYAAGETATMLIRVRCGVERAEGKGRGKGRGKG